MNVPIQTIQFTLANPCLSDPKSAPPRPPTATSTPALLHMLQNEWDAIVLEMFALKQQYNSTRQELSYALYAQDAASRVIARLIRERDAAREYAFSKYTISYILLTRPVLVSERWLMSRRL